MVRNKFRLVCHVCIVGLTALLTSPAFAQEHTPGPNQSAPNAAPAAPLSPDLTPPGYDPKDPLYNDAEVKLGRTASLDIAKSVKFSQDKALVTRVQTIGAKIAAVADTTQVPAGFGNDKVIPYHYTYHVIDSKEVNAFSLPGGFIYIYKGMLDLISSDDELAGVLGHETAHAAHHHVSTLDKEANKMSNGMLLGVLAAIVGHVDPGDIAALYSGASYGVEGELNNVFSEHAEEDADHTGMIFMQKAGYNPVGMLTMLERLEQEEKKSPDIDMGFLQDHPLTPERVAAAKAELSTLGVILDAETIREADDSLPVLVSPVSTTQPNSVSITVSGTPIITLAAGNRPEAIAVAKRLDSLFDGNLVGLGFQSKGSVLCAGFQPLLTVTDADAAVQSTPMTPEQVAALAAHQLGLVMWHQDVVGINND